MFYLVGSVNRSLVSSECLMFLFPRVLQEKSCVVKRDEVKLLAPVTSCDKVLCIGMNYIDHCEEQNAPVPVEPVIFNKFPSCIIGPNDELPYPKESKVGYHNHLNPCPAEPGYTLPLQTA